MTSATRCFYNSRSVEFTVGHLMKPNTKKLAKIMKALANEHRLNLYLGIAQNETSDFETPGCHCHIHAVVDGQECPIGVHNLTQYAESLQLF